MCSLVFLKFYIFGYTNKWFARLTWRQTIHYITVNPWCLPLVPTVALQVLVESDWAASSASSEGRLSPR